MKLCIECLEKPIKIKKHKLCELCYQKARYHNTIKTNIKKPNELKVTHQKEMFFIKNYFKHNNWVYHPATFHFNQLSYSTDFYDAERNVFIEVVGSRQAFHENKEKYELFKKHFHKIMLEIRLPDGTMLEKDENERYVWGTGTKSLHLVN